MSLPKRIAYNTLVQVAGKIASTILGLFALALITRYLGQDGYGQYTTITTFLTFFAVIADMGLTLVTVRLISGQNAGSEEERKMLNNLFGLRLVSILVFIILAPLIVLAMPYSQEIKIGVLLTAAAFIFPALNQVIIGLLQKRLSMDRAAVAEIFSRLVLVLGVMASVSLGAGLKGVLAATVASALASFIGHYCLAKKFVVVRPAFDPLIWRKIIRVSWPLAVTIIFNLIYLRADTLVLSLFRSQGEVGLYGATYRIIDVLTSLPFMFAGLILPILTAAWLEKNREYFQKILQNSLDVMLAVALPVIVGAQFLAKPVMIFVAGRDFAAAGPILSLLVFGVGAIFIGTMYSHAVIAIDKQKRLIGYYAFTSLSSLLAYIILIPKYSYLGAAAVTVYSEVMIAIFSAYNVIRYSHFKPKLHFAWRAVIASLLMALCLYFFPKGYEDTLGGLGLIIILSSLVYFFSLYAVGGIKPEHLALIFKKSKKSGGPAYDPSQQP